MSSDSASELYGLFAKKKYGVASVLGVVTVLAVVHMHAFPMGIFRQNAHALTSQTATSPVSYATPLLQLPSLAKVAGISAKPSLPHVSWLNAFGRGGSTSTTAFMQRVGKTVTSGPDFTSMPCHITDVARKFHNCGEEMHSLLQCDFSDITFLASWGGYWAGSVTPIHWCCPEPWTPATASRRCLEAFVKNFKTEAVDLQTSILPNLKSFPKLHVINVVRDPRGIYQSQKKAAKTWAVWEPGLIDYGFAGQDGRNLYWYDPFLSTTLGNPGHLRRMCSTQVRMTNISHPRLSHVRIEDLVAASDAAKNIVSFLGYPWNSDVEQIAKDIFPGLSPGFTWAHFNHYPDNSENPWTTQELEALYGVHCQLALASWAYPLRAV